MRSELKKRRIILALVLLLIIGIVVALAIILPRFKGQKNVVASIEVQAASVTGNTRYILSSGNTKFTANDESGIKYIADVKDVVLTPDTYVSYQYDIQNTGSDTILFELTLEAERNQNCDIKYSVGDLTTRYDFTDSIIGTVNSSETIRIVLDIKIDNPSNDTLFIGNIGLKLSVV